MKNKVVLTAITAILILCLTGCVGAANLGSVVFEDGEVVTGVLIRDEESGQTVLITDGEALERFIAAVNGTACLRYSGGVEASDSGKSVRYVISVNPSGDSISLEDDLLFVYSESEFHAGEYNYKAISGGIGDFLNDCM